MVCGTGFKYYRRSSFEGGKIDSNLRISNIKQIIGLRHILVHDYDKIDTPQLFLILQNNLPLLKEEVENILSTK